MDGPYTAKGYKLLNDGVEVARYDFSGVADIYARHMNAAHAEAQAVVARNITGWASSLDDADLLAAYQRTDGEPGNPEADALAAEIKRRGLDI